MLEKQLLLNLEKKNDQRSVINLLETTHSISSLLTHDVLCVTSTYGPLTHFQADKT